MLFAPVSVFASDASSTETGDSAVEISSGPIYETAKSIFPDIYLAASSDCITFDLSAIKCATEYETSQKLIRYSVYLLAHTGFEKEYEKAMFVFYDTDSVTVASITISDYENIGKFTSRLLAYGNTNLYLYITTVYQNVFGRFDSNYSFKKSMNDLSEEYGMETEEIEVCDNNSFWAYASFEPNTFYAKVSDSDVTFIQFENYENTEYYGSLFCEQIKNAMNNYAYIHNNDMGSLTFSSFLTLCTSQEDEALGCVMMSLDSSMHWETSKCELSQGSDFEKGFIEKNNSM